MKQYLDKLKCEKLIGLGFPLPYRYDLGEMDDVNALADIYPAIRDENGWLQIYKRYNIGEILEFLPSMITAKAGNQMYYRVIDGSNIVKYYDYQNQSLLIASCKHLELIDNLYELCVILKKKKLI